MSLDDHLWNAEVDQFAHRVHGEFQRRTKGRYFREVPLFRHFRAALVECADTIKVEEYHGRKSEVCFRSAPPWTRVNKPPACELSDLAIVWVYGRQRHLDVRVSFLQAKWSDEIHGCAEETLPCNERFRGNSTQWYLLNKRPEIWPSHSKFNPPPDLLKGAVLPSIASFGVFHDTGYRDYEFFYGSADSIICPPPKRANKKARMHCASPHRFLTIGPYIEEKFSPSLRGFSSALLRGRVGSPISLDDKVTNSEKAYRERIGGWIVSGIRALNGRPEGGQLFNVLASHFDDSAGEFRDKLEHSTGVDKFLLIGGGDLPP